MKHYTIKYKVEDAVFILRDYSTPEALEYTIYNEIITRVIIDSEGIYYEFIRFDKPISEDFIFNNLDDLFNKIKEIENEK